MSVKHIKLLDDLSEDERQAVSSISRVEYPVWVVPRGEAGYRIVDSVFVEEFCRERELHCINGVLYGEDSRIEDRAIRAAIQTEIKPWCDTALSNKVASLFEAVRNEAFEPAPALDPQLIHCTDGSIRISGNGAIKYEEPSFALNRMNVSCRLGAEAPTWERFLSELLDPDDVLTLQEYLGYCLIPTTRAQVMLFLIGRGGEGKSRIGVVLNAIFRGSMITGKLNDIQEDRFAGAQLEGRLLFLDDDLKGTKLKDTDLIKSIVTAETPMQVQRKGVDLYSVMLYSRMMAFGNQAMSSIFDRSDGFYRRQIVLTCKPRPAERIDDPSLSDKLLAERQGIFCWMIAGLQRLLKNKFRFTRSARSIAYMEAIREQDNNVILFLKDKSAVQYGGSYTTSSRELYDAYRRWCTANAEPILSERTVLSYLKDNAETYGVKFMSHIIVPGSDRRPRGFQGIHILRESFQITV